MGFVKRLEETGLQCYSKSFGLITMYIKLLSLRQRSMKSAQTKYTTDNFVMLLPIIISAHFNGLNFHYRTKLLKVV